jgi:hypothetical protein
MWIWVWKTRAELAEWLAGKLYYVGSGDGTIEMV